MSFEDSLVGQLLVCAAARKGERSTGRIDERQIAWALTGGLGPLLSRAIAEDELDAIPAAGERLMAADLQARLCSASIAQAAARVFDLFAGVGIEPVLLKGISVAYDLYPAPHMRPMGDIDLFVPGGAAGAAEAALLEAGFEQPADTENHHLRPLRDPATGVWIELHTGLFSPPDAPLRRGATFSRPSIEQHLVPSSLLGRAAARLTPEFQLAYISSSWMNDIIGPQGIQPSFLASLFDAVYLLRKHASGMDWRALLRLLETPMARASTYVTLSYLARHRLAALPADLCTELRAGQKYVGRFQNRILHAVIDRYLIGARAWGAPFPPPVPGRYRLGYQWGKRIARRLGDGY